MRSLLMRFAFVFFSISSFLYAEKPRVISVCVLNDTTPSVRGYAIRPVSMKRIKKIIRRASRQYRSNVGIAFKVVEVHELVLPIAPSTVSPATLRGLCTQGDMVAIFTNQSGSDGNGIYFDGWSNEEYGIVWNYQVDSLDVSKLTKLRVLLHNVIHYNSFTLGEASMSATTNFMHEVAHIFGVAHSRGNTDFMYAGVGSNEWSSGIRTGIRRHANRIWSR